MTCKKPDIARSNRLTALQRRLAGCSYVVDDRLDADDLLGDPERDSDRSASGEPSPMMSRTRPSSVTTWRDVGLVDALIAAVDPFEHRSRLASWPRPVSQHGLWHQDHPDRQRRPGNRAQDPGRVLARRHRLGRLPVIGAVPGLGGPLLARRHRSCRPESAGSGGLRISKHLKVRHGTTLTLRVSVLIR